MVMVIMFEQEAVMCVRELNCRTYLPDFVTLSVNHVLEWSTESRSLLGQLLSLLIDDKLVTIDQYVIGLVLHYLTILLLYNYLAHRC